MPRRAAQTEDFQMALPVFESIQTRSNGYPLSSVLARNDLSASNKTTGVALLSEINTPPFLIAFGIRIDFSPEVMIASSLFISILGISGNPDSDCRIGMYGAVRQRSRPYFLVKYILEGF